jgi:hypothetical protein
MSDTGGFEANLLAIIQSTGQVGVGTLSPGLGLRDTNGWIQTEGARFIVNGFDGAPGNFWFRTTAAEPGSVFLAFTASAGGSAEAVTIAPQNNLGLYVNSVGNVGVRTWTPASALDVGGVISVMGVETVDTTGTALRAYSS